MDESEELAALRAENARLRAELEASRAAGQSPPPPSSPVISGGPVIGEGKPMSGCAKWALGGVGFLILLIVLGMCTASKTPSKPEAATAPAAGDAKPADSAKPAAPVPAPASPDADKPAAPAEPATAWRYDQSEDPMGGVTKTACVTSVNEVSLDFPYHTQPMTLCLRRSPKFGLDAYASLVSDGQILCSTYSRCHIRVRFDDKPAVAWSGADAADGSSNIVFLTRTAGLIAKIKSAKRMRLELEFYQAGVQTVEFPVEGLKW